MRPFFDAVTQMFTRVTSRAPTGKAISAEAVQKMLTAIQAEVNDVLEFDDYPTFDVPAIYLDFWRQFGGEKQLTDSMTTLFPPDELETSTSHRLFGMHHTAKGRFGIDHFVPQDADPPAMLVSEENLEAEMEENDDIWQDWTETLSAGLTEIARENLMRSLGRIVVLEQSPTEGIRRVRKRSARHGDSGPSLDSDLFRHCNCGHPPRITPACLVMHPNDSVSNSEASHEGTPRH